MTSQWLSAMNYKGWIQTLSIFDTLFLLIWVDRVHLKKTLSTLGIKKTFKSFYFLRYCLFQIWVWLGRNCNCVKRNLKHSSQSCAIFRGGQQAVLLLRPCGPGGHRSRTPQALQGKRRCGISSTTMALTQGDTLALEWFEPSTWTLVRVQHPRTPSPQV